MMHEVDYTDWQARRQAEIGGPDSWQGMVGLFWLSEGRHPLGGPDADIAWPGLETCVGHVEWCGEHLIWMPSEGAAQPLETDRDGAPTVVSLGDHAFFVVERQGRRALRVRDRAWASRGVPLRVDYYPVDPAWRIEARWVALSETLVLEVPNVAGELNVIEVREVAEFEHEGQTIRLLPTSVAADAVFFVFRDRTSGRETYGAGRFLRVPPAVDGRLVLDFNLAFNPPCAFTAFATCPLPPPENWLAFPVRAGEQRPYLPDLPDR